MRPTHFEVGLCGQLVRYNAEKEPHPRPLSNGRGECIDGGREQTITIATDTCNFKILHFAVWGEFAIGTNSSHPTKGTNANASIQRSAGEEIFSITHRCNVGHFPECSMLVGITSLEEDGTIVCPRAIFVFMQRADSNVVLAGTDDDILLSVCRKEIGITEIV